MCGNNVPWYSFNEAILECMGFRFGRGLGPQTASQPIKTKMPGTPSRPLSKKKKAELAAVARAAKKRKSNDDDDNSEEEETDVVEATVIDGDAPADNQAIEEADAGESPEQPEKGALQKTKYMSSRVRGETTGTVFRAAKFLNTPKLVDTTLEKLATLFTVTAESRTSWKLLYQKEMVYALNNKRNSVYQDMKPKIQGKSENRLNQHRSIISQCRPIGRTVRCKS
jgi:hypothetical protein